MVEPSQLLASVDQSDLKAVLAVADQLDSQDPLHHLRDEFLIPKRRTVLRATR